MNIKIPHTYDGYIHQQQIFQQKSCPLMILELESDFRTSRGTQLQEGKGSYIVCYLVDDDVKVKMIPVIIGSTGTLSRSFKKYLNNRSGMHEIKEVQNKEKEPKWTLNTYEIQKALK